MWFLGIDIGTTHLKVAGITAEGTLLPAGRLRTPTVHSDGLAHHDAEEIWRSTAGLVAEYARTTAAAHGPLGGVAVASFGQEESVAVDRSGRMIHPSLAWWESSPGLALDPDTAARLDSFEQFRVSGLRHRPNQTPERMALLRARRPDVWRSTARWVDFCTFVTERLTGTWASAASQITHSQCFDLATLTPHVPTLELLGLTPDLFAPVLPTGADAGEIRTAALPGVRVAPGARVVLGGHDQVLAARQVRATSGADVLDSIGTSEYLMVTTDTFAPQRRSWELGIDHERSWHDGAFLLGYPIPTGKVVQLLAELFHDGDFDAMFERLADTGPGEPSSLRVTVDSMNEAGGGLLDLRGVPAGARPADVVRACLDHLADLARTRVDEMCALAGTRPETVALMGSLFRRPEMAGHRRERWDLPLHISQLAEPVAYGAAAVARDAVAADRSGDAERRQA